MMIRALLVSLSVVLPLGVAAQDYPSKPITLYVPFAAGGGTDLSVRMVEQTVAKILGQRVLVVNKPGTATIYQVATAVPDGYTLAVGSTGNTASLPHNPGTPYSLNDYVPVVQLTNVPALLVVPNGSPYKDLEEIVAAARKSPPGFIKVGISPTASISHLAAIQIEKAFNIKFTYVPHRSNGEVVTSILGSHVDMGSVDIAAGGPKMREKALRGIAIYQNARMPEFPDLRTVKEQGADISFGFYNIILAPKGTPEPIIKTLNEAFRKALADPEVVERSKTLNIPIAYLGSQDSRSMINTNYEIFGNLLRELGLTK